MSDRMRTILIAVVAALVAFAVGFLWQYASARRHAERLEVAERDLTLQRLEATLGAATIEALRGSHEIARQLASDFFTRLQAHHRRAEPQQRQTFEEILARRDLIITALSRADPQSGSMLAQMFTRYRIALGEPVGPESGANSTAPTTTGGS
jgi:CRP-like cAMP-binding protein